MDPRLKALIETYIEAVAECVAQLAEAGAELPSKDYQWPPDNFEPSGILPDGRSYWCHGVGCAVRSTSGQIVDFDFGEDGETNGFCLSRLLTYAGNRTENFGFVSRDEIATAYQDAIGEFRFSGFILYYLR